MSNFDSKDHLAALHQPTSNLRHRKSAGPAPDDEYSSTFTKTLKSIDFFDKVKDEVIDTKTKSGGFISVLAVFIVAIILITEMDYYFFQEVHVYNYKVDTKSNKIDQHILLTFDIIVKTPCNQIGAGVSDEAGADIRSLDDISEQPAFFDMETVEQTRYRKVRDLQQDQLNKDQILTKNLPSEVLPPSVKSQDGDGDKKSSAKEDPAKNALAAIGGGPGNDVFMQFGGKHMAGLGDLGAMMQQMLMAQQAMDQMMRAQMNPLSELAKPAYNKGEKGQVPDSCRFFGQTTLAKVKGTLHIVEGKRIKIGGMMGMMSISGFNQKRPDFTHRINQLRFSTVQDESIDISGLHEDLDRNNEKENLFIGPDATNKDYSLQALDAHTSEPHGGFYQYFLSVVGINFPHNKKEPKYYQYSVTETSESKEYSDHNGIIFKYDFSPILVEIEYKQSSSVILFIVRMCSIVGGVISLASFLTRMSWCIS